MSPTPLFDYHVHPDWSFDGHGRPTEYIHQASARGIPGIIFTPHVYHLPERRETFAIVREAGQPVSLDDSNWFQRYREDLNHAAVDQHVEVRAGIEIDYDIRELNWLEEFLDHNQPDFIIGSIHLLHGCNLMVAEDFKQLLETADLHLLLTAYLRKVQEMVEWGRIDTVAHLCCYLRHVPGLLSVAPILPDQPLQELFSTMARGGVALEISTALFRQGGDSLNPPAEILAMAARQGVRHFTLASDAHTPIDLGSRLDEAWSAGQTAGLELFPFPAKKKQADH